MILFCILALMIVGLGIFVITTVATVGTALIIPLADIIVCIVFLVLLAKWLIKKH